jgi:chromate transporter
MSALSLKRLLLLSLRVGNSTFGGGEPTMAVFQRELVSRRGWLSPEQYGLAYGLARVTPGTNVLAFCAAAGWQVLKWPGALAVVLAVTVPSAGLVVLLTATYRELKTNPFVMGAISGTVAAAVGMMAAAAWLLIRPQLRPSGWLRTLSLVAGCVILSLAFSMPPVQVLALAGLAGFLWRDSSRP